MFEPSPARGKADSPLSGGDVERSETEGVGDLAAGQTDEGEGSILHQLWGPTPWAGHFAEASGDLQSRPPYALHLSNFRRAGLRLWNGSKFGIILGAAPSIPAPEGGEIHGPSRRILCVGRSKHSCLLCLQVA